MKGILKEKNIFADGLYSIKVLIKFWLIYVGFPIALEIKTLKPRVEKLCVWWLGSFRKPRGRRQQKKIVKSTVCGKVRKISSEPRDETVLVM